MFRFSRPNLNMSHVLLHLQTGLLPFFLFFVALFKDDMSWSLTHGRQVWHLWWIIAFGGNWKICALIHYVKKTSLLTASALWHCCSLTIICVSSIFHALNKIILKAESFYLLIGVRCKSPLRIKHDVVLLIFKYKPICQVNFMPLKNFIKVFKKMERTKSHLSFISDTAEPKEPFRFFFK